MILKPSGKIGTLNSKQYVCADDAERARLLQTSLSVLKAGCRQFVLPGRESERDRDRETETQRDRDRERQSSTVG